MTCIRLGMQRAIENAIRMIFQAYSKAPSALAERLFPAFQDVAHSFARRALFKSTSRVGDWRQPSCGMWACARDNDLVSIGNQPPDPLGIL